MKTANSPKVIDSNSVYINATDSSARIPAPVDGQQAWSLRIGNTWFAVTYVERYGWVESADVSRARDLV